MHRSLLIGFVVSLLTVAPLSAQVDIVGKEAPAFRAGSMFFDEDESSRTLADCTGEVVLIKYWGLNCPPCKAAMPGVQRIWNEYKGKGFHVFHVESQGHSAEAIQAYCEKNNFSFPQTLPNDSEFGGYQGGNGLPYAFVVGVEGKVVWQGRSGYDNIIAQEMEKVKYPGLGKANLAAGLERAGSLFVAKQYASALKEAQKKAEKPDATAEMKDDVAFLTARIEAIGTQRLAAAESAVSQREFASAVARFESLAQDFKGLAPAETATQKLEGFKADKDVKKELSADKALVACLEQVRKLPTKEKQAEMLNAFAERYTGTTAAEKAKRRVALL